MQFKNTEFIFTYTLIKYQKWKKQMFHTASQVG